MERRVVQWHAENVSLGGPLLRRVDDIRQLRPLQSARRHSRRRILFRGTFVANLRSFAGQFRRRPELLTMLLTT